MVAFAVHTGVLVVCIYRALLSLFLILLVPLPHPSFGCVHAMHATPFCGFSKLMVKRGPIIPCFRFCPFTHGHHTAFGFVEFKNIEDVDQWKGEFELQGQYSFIKIVLLILERICLICDGDQRFYESL